MKKIITCTENAYQTTVCISINVCVEGLICKSSETEGYDSIGEYGNTELDNKGWL